MYVWDVTAINKTSNSYLDFNLKSLWKWRQRERLASYVYILLFDPAPIFVCGFGVCGICVKLMRQISGGSQGNTMAPQGQLLQTGSPCPSVSRKMYNSPISTVCNINRRVWLRNFSLVSRYGGGLGERIRPTSQFGGSVSCSGRTCLRVVLAPSESQLRRS